MLFFFSRFDSISVYLFFILQYSLTKRRKRKKKNYFGQKSVEEDINVVRFE
jgi:hypothetical protein